MSRVKKRPFPRAVQEAGRGPSPSAPAALGAFPQVRMRRNRTDDWVRRMIAESALTSDDMLWPVFLRESEAVPAEVESMPGVRRYTLDEVVDAVGGAGELGIPAVALFPLVPEERKTEDCAEAVDPDNLICRAVRRLKAELPEVGVVCDVALDPYNALGHDGLVADGRILNDETLEVLCQQALVQAEAGCDVIAPSDMMDGRIGAIREALDGAALQDVKLCSYAAKYASAFYGPFRDAVGSGGALKGDKKTYQIDPANSDEALREVALDIQELSLIHISEPTRPY